MRSTLNGLSRRMVSLVLLPAAVAACGSSNSSLDVGPSLPPTPFVETYSGILTRNGANTYPFSVTEGGDVGVFLLEVSELNNPGGAPVPIGVSLGTWNGVSCAIVIANDNILPISDEDPLQGRMNGRATAAGNLCVRVYDVGFASGSLTYRLQVDHP